MSQRPALILAGCPHFFPAPYVPTVPPIQKPVLWILTGLVTCFAQLDVVEVRPGNFYLCFLRTQLQGEEIQALLLQRKALEEKKPHRERGHTEENPGAHGLWKGLINRKCCCLLCCCGLLLSCIRLFVTPWTPPGSSVCGILPARILEWVATSSCRGLNPHLLLSCIESGFCTTEPPGKAIGNEKLNSIHQVCMELQALCGARGIPRKMIWSQSLSSWIVLILNMIIVPTECYCGK